MGLPKGRTNNINGRPKGTANKVTNELREKFTQLLEANFEKIQSDIDALEPKDRIKTILELSKFVLPTLKATDLSLGVDVSKRIDYSKYTTEDLEVMDKILKKYEYNQPEPIQIVFND